MKNHIRRRHFITLLGGAAAAWPLGARAQQPVQRMRRIGVFVNWTEDDAEESAKGIAFVQALQQLRWTEGRNGGLTTVSPGVAVVAIAPMRPKWPRSHRMSS
jgi:hypothetical protein